MRLTIGIKIFGIAIGLLILMGAAAALSLLMTRTVDDQLAMLDDDYFPAYATLAQANTRSVEESAFIRRLMLAFEEDPRDEAKIADLQRRAGAAAADSDAGIAEARRLINSQIAGGRHFQDDVALGRLDTRLEFLQEERHTYRRNLPACSMRHAIVRAMWPNCSTTSTRPVTISIAASPPVKPRCAGSPMARSTVPAFISGTSSRSVCS